MQKLYVYVDESGQDTKGRFFLVAVVIAEGKLKESVRLKLEAIEKESGKRLLKWRSIKLKHREDYLRRVAGISELSGAISYAVFGDTKEYLDLTASTIGKAILARREKKFQAIVIVDGLNKVERQLVSRRLKALGVGRKKVRGARFRSDAFIRLADALAGFLRDYEEGQPHAKRLFEYLGRSVIIKKIK